MDAIISFCSNTGTRYPPKEIGRALTLSPRTVETHRAHVFAKLDVESLAALIRRYAALVEDA